MTPLQQPCERDLPCRGAVRLRDSTIAPLLCACVKGGELWAADERGVHRSDNGGKSWRRAVGYATSPEHLRGLALVQ